MHRSVDIHQSTAWWRSHRATSRCTAGSARRQRSGRGGQRVAWTTPVSVALALPQRQPDQHAHDQHHGDRMPVKARPQPALILVPAPRLFGLLMPLLDGVPACASSTTSSNEADAGRLLQSDVCSSGGPRAVRSPHNQPLRVSPSAVIRPARTATTFLRRPPLRPCRQRIVRHWRRGTADHTWSTRWAGGAARQCGRTGQSDRPATT